MKKKFFEKKMDEEQEEEIFKTQVRYIIGDKLKLKLKFLLVFIQY